MEKIKHIVMQQIETGKAVMRPRWQFVMTGILTVLGILVVMAVVLFLVSFTIFALRQSGAIYLTGFGIRGLFALLAVTPWALVVVSVIFLVVLLLFVRHYPLVYKKPLLYTSVLFIVFGLVGGYAVAESNVHRTLFRASIEKKLFVGDRLYRMYGTPREHRVFPGEIREIQKKDSFSIETIRGDIFTVSIDDQTRLPHLFTPIVGMRVVVMGDVASGTIFADGVVPVPDHDSFEFSGPGRQHGKRLFIKELQATPTTSQSEIMLPPVVY